MARWHFILRNLYGPGGHSSDLTELVTTEERAEYIRTVLWPEQAMCGRPGVFAPTSSDTQAERDAKRRSQDGECEEPGQYSEDALSESEEELSMAHSLVTD